MSNIEDTGNLFFKKSKPGPSRIRNTEDLHRQYEYLLSGREEISESKFSKTRFPYEFFASADRGWWPCDIVKVYEETESVKVIFYHPDSKGWMDVAGAAGIYDDVVEIWRVRVREE